MLSWSWLASLLCRNKYRVCLNGTKISLNLNHDDQVVSSNESLLRCQEWFIRWWKGWLLLFRKLPSISVFHKIIPQTMNKHSACCMIDQPQSKYWDLSQWAKREKGPEPGSLTVLMSVVPAWQIYASHAPVGKRALAGSLVGLQCGLQSPAGPTDTNQQHHPTSSILFIKYFLKIIFHYSLLVRNARILMLSYYSIINYWQLIHSMLCLVFRKLI